MSPHWFRQFYNTKKEKRKFSRKYCVLFSITFLIPLNNSDSVSLTINLALLRNIDFTVKMNALYLIKKIGETILLILLAILLIQCNKLELSNNYYHLK